MKATNIIKEKLLEKNGVVEIGLLKGNRSFIVRLTDGGVMVNNLANAPYLSWEVFEKAVELLEQEGGRL